MGHPAVDYVLDKVKTNWSAGTYGDIPIERIDRDNSEKLDGNVRSHTEDLQANNFVGAAFADRIPEPIGTEYDLDVDVVVSVRIEGLHHTEFGYVNPDNSLPPTTAGDPVPWTDFVKEIRSTINTERTFPNTTSSINYTDLVITNENPLSYEYGDYYRHEFDVAFAGYEDL